MFILIVLAWNVQCAVVFLLWPAESAAGFELSGAPGEAMLRGLGVLFLMWNVPYIVAFWHPLRNCLSLYEAIGMQAIGLVGESLILVALPGTHNLARAGLMRFIIFDGLGLLLLLGAAWVIRKG